MNTKKGFTKRVGALTAALAIAVGGAGFVAGCGSDNDDASDEVEDAASTVEDAANDASSTVEDAANDVDESVGDDDGSGGKKSD
jgi:hypothetical protein